MIVVKVFAFVIMVVTMTELENKVIEMTMIEIIEVTFQKKSYWMRLLFDQIEIFDKTLDWELLVLIH